MAGSPRDELEARVARLEGLLNRVLELLQDSRRDLDGEVGEGGEEIPWEFLRAQLDPQVPSENDPISPETEPEPLEPEGAPAGVSLKDKPRPSDRYDSESEKEAPGASASGPKAADGKEDTDGMGTRAPTGPGFLGDLGILAPGGTFLSRVGIVLLLLSVAFFFKYSIDQGWLTEWVRLAMGVAAGVVLVVLGFNGASKGEPLGTVLAGGGIATFFITGFVGHQWFGLVSYPAAFAFLVVASGLGIVLALRSGLQALAMVGLIGALATPLLLTAPSPDVAGLALYVCLIVASVAAIYMARAWRALFLVAVATSWVVLSIAVGNVDHSAGTSLWVVQGGIVFCALTFWLLPLLRARLRADNPGRWLRPESAYPAEEGFEQEEILRTGLASWMGGDRTSASGGPFVPWNVHLDVLSLLMPLVGIGYSAWLWDLPRLDLGWVFLCSALLAQGVGTWISRSPDPEDSAGTQTFVAVLLSTVGLGLVLTGDVLYLAFIAEAVALFTVGSRKGSKVLMGLGGAVEILVVGLFLFRLVFGGTLLEGDGSSLFDLLAIVGAAFIGSRLRNPDAQRGFYVGAYLALLAFTARELAGHPSFLYLAFLLEAVATHFAAARRKSPVLEGLGFASLGLVGVGFVTGIASGRTLAEGNLTLLVDVAALVGVVYVGTLLTRPKVRQGLFAGAYVGLVALFGRELREFLPLLYSVFILMAVLTQVAAAKWRSAPLSILGHIPSFLALGLFFEGMESGRSISNGDLVSLLDLAALVGAAYVGTIVKARELRLVYLYAAYVGLLAWTGREFLPFEQGQALMSLAFGVEGTVLLVWGLLTERTLMHKTGMATLLLVVAKILTVDLAAVEPIWRVLLLFLFAVLFLALSKIVQGRKGPGGGGGGG